MFDAKKKLCRAGCHHHTRWESKKVIRTRFRKYKPYFCVLCRIYTHTAQHCTHYISRHDTRLQRACVVTFFCDKKTWGSRKCCWVWSSIAKLWITLVTNVGFSLSRLGPTQPVLRLGCVLMGGSPFGSPTPRRRSRGLYRTIQDVSHVSVC